MKQIILLFLGALLLCMFIGVVISLVFHCSWWFSLLICVPISFGWIFLAEIFRRADSHLKGTTILTIVLFFLVIGAILLSAYCCVDEQSFWGMTLAGGLVSYMLGILLILFRLSNKWTDRKRIEWFFIKN